MTRLRDKGGKGRWWCVAAAVAVLVCWPGAAAACSKMTFMAPRAQPSFFFTFTALPDTVDAGAVGARSDWGRPIGGEGPLWGQVVQLGRAGGPAAAAIPEGATQVVLVPWAYTPSCELLRLLPASAPDSEDALRPARQRLAAWAAAHPELAPKWPAVDALLMYGLLAVPDGND